MLSGERTGNDSSVLVLCFISPASERTAPVTLPHHHVWFLSKCLLRKKPRVWPGLILGFREFPSAGSRRVVARTFAPHLAGQKVKLALAQRGFWGDQRQTYWNPIFQDKRWGRNSCCYSLCLHCDHCLHSARSITADHVLASALPSIWI